MWRPESEIMMVSEQVLESLYCDKIKRAESAVYAAENILLCCEEQIFPSLTTEYWYSLVVC